MAKKLREELIESLGGPLEVILFDSQAREEATAVKKVSGRERKSGAGGATEGRKSVVMEEEGTCPGRGASTLRVPTGR